MEANRLQVGTASSSDASISVASRRAQSTRNWGRAREGSREGERREAISWPFCLFFAARERERRLGTRQRLGAIQLGANRLAKQPN